MLHSWMLQKENTMKDYKETKQTLRFCQNKSIQNMLLLVCIHLHTSQDAQTTSADQSESFPHSQAPAL